MRKPRPTMWDIMHKWANNIDHPERMIRTYRGTRTWPDGVNVDPDDHTHLRYGHETLARYIDGDPSGAFWLLNGDLHGRGGWSHDNMGWWQDKIREIVTDVGLRHLILPFGVLQSAGINRLSIRPVDIRPDHWEDIHHYTDDLSEVPSWAQKVSVYDDRNRWLRYEDIQPDGDGTYHWTSQRHWLGASVFTASYAYNDYQHTDEHGLRDYPHITGSAYFLSDFDTNEPRMSYFLCQLPGWAHPRTISEALDNLQPREVLEARTRETDVWRQGDVFAIATTHTTADLRNIGRQVISPSGGGYPYVLGTSHTATRVIVVPEDHGPIHAGTYASGCLRHHPPHGRRPEHQLVRMGDPKVWHRLVRNTVPEGRSWQLEGRVD